MFLHFPSTSLAVKRDSHNNHLSPTHIIYIYIYIYILFIFIFAKKQR
ncbi:hypothetical protein K6L59_03710 [Candidatus Phytoplasma sp. Tabriz.2]|nr:hypothetical protein [Candidatus Phytoplasma australiense]